MKKHMATLIFLSALFVSGAVLAQESPALSPKSPIPLTKVEGRMDHLGIDVQGQRLFATAFDNHTLEVIDLRQAVKYIPSPNWTRTMSVTTPGASTSSSATEEKSSCQAKWSDREEEAHSRFWTPMERRLERSPWMLTLNPFNWKRLERESS